MMIGFLKTKDINIFISPKRSIHYLAGYPVSGKVIGRLSGQISIRYNPNTRLIQGVYRISGLAGYRITGRIH